MSDYCQIDVIEIQSFESVASVTLQVDFECPVGTPVIAVGDGEIIEVQEENEVD